MVDTLITVARETVEFHTNRALLTQTITMAMPCFPSPTFHEPIGYFELFRSPLQEFKTVEYYDSDNVLQTWYDLDAANTSNLILNTIAEPARVQLAKDKSWPTTYPRTDAVKVTFVCGWSSASLVPTPLRQAMLLLIGEMYERRENFIKKLPDAVDWLLAPHTVRQW
jgi:uncharacterized phiE125 gp8 family phage protein